MSGAVEVGVEASVSPGLLVGSLVISWQGLCASDPCPQLSHCSEVPYVAFP